jgi:hypothetical protein
VAPYATANDKWPRASRCPSCRALEQDDVERRTASNGRIPAYGCVDEARAAAGEETAVDVTLLEPLARRARVGADERDRRVVDVEVRAHRCMAPDEAHADARRLRHRADDFD